MIGFLLKVLGYAVVFAACVLVYFCLADASSMTTLGVVLVGIGCVAILLRRTLFAGRTSRKVSVGVSVALGAALAALLAYALLRGPSAALVADSVEKQTLRFYREGSEWYADVPGHLKSENRMVAGADLVLDRVSGGSSNVVITFSADRCEGDRFLVWLHAVEHDEWGALYRVKIAGKILPRMAWLCNVTHTVFGGEHPRDIFIYSIERRD